MQLIEFLLDLRAELYEKVTRVEDASSWDILFRPTDSNFITKRNLEAIYSRYWEKLHHFGILSVERHISCQNPNHVPYIASNKYGLDIPDQDERYEWGIHQENYKDINCVCPCSPDNVSSIHTVLEETIYLKSNKNVCLSLLSIMKEIKSSIYCSGDNRPRSGIREHLIMAIMKIDNQLLPGGISNYVEHLRKLYT